MTTLSILKPETPRTTSPLDLAPCRVHEAGGTGAPIFAMAQAMQTSGAVAWIQPAQQRHGLMPGGLPQDLVERLLIIRPKNETDLLWAAEETLRSSAIAMVVAKPTKPLSLTAGRRLQLAAEAGQTLGLMLIADGMGSNAAETRWHCAPIADSTQHHWSLKKNKRGTIGRWRVSFDIATHTLRVVSKVADGSFD